MKKNRLEVAYRESEILRLCKEKIYVPSLGIINSVLGKANAIQLIRMDLTAEEISYVRPSDNFSLLHLSIASSNPYLVAFFVSRGVKGVTSRELIEKTGHLVQGMSSAFYHPNEFLEEEGCSVDYEVVEKFGLNSESEPDFSYLDRELYETMGSSPVVIGEFLDI